MSRPSSTTAPRSTAAPSGRDTPGQQGAWLHERMWLIDLLVAGGVFLYSLPLVPLYTDSAGRAAAVVVILVALCAPYLLRSRFPLGVLAFMLLAAGAQLLLGAPLLAADTMLLFAVYNLASRRDWRVSLPGALITVAWLLISILPRMGELFIDIGQLGVLIVVTLWVWTWGMLVRIRRQYVAGLQERTEQAERERETNAQIAVADERARIAREIHDIVAHSLSVVVVMSDGAATKVDSEPERAKVAMVGVRDTGRTALAEMRRMLAVLRDNEPGSHAPQPGIAQLDALIEQSRAADLPVSLTVQGAPGSVPDSVGLSVYRVVQEALTNVRKHAGPDVTSVEVGVHVRPGEVEVSIVDDGQGPSAPQNDHVGGHGLVGMRERVAAHRGTLSVGSRDGRGYEVVTVLLIEGKS